MSDPLAEQWKENYRAIVDAKNKALSESWEQGKRETVEKMAEDWGLSIEFCTKTFDQILDDYNAAVWNGTKIKRRAFGATSDDMEELIAAEFVLNSDKGL